MMEKSGAEKRTTRKYTAARNAWVFRAEAEMEQKEAFGGKGRSKGEISNCERNLEM